MGGCTLNSAEENGKGRSTAEKDADRFTCSSQSPMALATVIPPTPDVTIINVEKASVTPDRVRWTTVPGGFAMAAKRGVLRQHGESRTVHMGKNTVSLVLTGDDTGGAYSLTEFTIAAPPAPGPPVHIHGTGSEAAYVLEGEVELRLEDQTVKASAGAAIFVPKGTTHNVSNAGPGTAKILVILSPPGFEGYWREMSELPLTDGKPDPQAVLALQAKYKMDTGGQARQL